MDPVTALICSLLGIIVGYRLARAKNARKLKKMERKHIAANHELHSDAFMAGWDAALMSPNTVRKAYHNLYGTPIK